MEKSFIVLVLMMLYFVYITTNKNRTVFYIGVTNNVIRRINEHKAWILEWFTHKYHVDILVYYEEFQYITDAILREKQLKKRWRNKKIELIKRVNRNLDEVTYE